MTAAFLTWIDSLSDPVFALLAFVLISAIFLGLNKLDTTLVRRRAAKRDAAFSADHSIPPRRDFNRPTPTKRTRRS